MHRRRSEDGFTLIELMITVAIIALLAGIAVPAFFGQSRKQKAKSEVGAMFGELAIREEQWLTENGSYLATAACPTTPMAQGQDPSPCLASGQPWNTMRVRIQESKLFCSYAITAGNGTGTTGPGTFNTWSSPAGAWFYILATCDMNNDTTLNSTYFMSSTGAGMLTANEGY